LRSSLQSDGKLFFFIIIFLLSIESFCCHNVENWKMKIKIFALSLSKLFDSVERWKMN
jgi:hypothetical protein